MMFTFCPQQCEHGTHRGVVTAIQYLVPRILDEGRGRGGKLDVNLHKIEYGRRQTEISIHCSLHWIVLIVAIVIFNAVILLLTTIINWMLIFLVSLFQKVVDTALWAVLLYCYCSLLHNVDSATFLIRHILSKIDIAADMQEADDTSTRSLLLHWPSSSYSIKRKIAGVSSYRKQCAPVGSIRPGGKKNKVCFAASNLLTSVSAVVRSCLAMSFVSWGFSEALNATVDCCLETMLACDLIAVKPLTTTEQEVRSRKKANNEVTSIIFATKLPHRQ